MAGASGVGQSGGNRHVRKQGTVADIVNSMRERLGYTRSVQKATN